MDFGIDAMCNSNDVTRASNGMIYGSTTCGLTYEHPTDPDRRLKNAVVMMDPNNPDNNRIIEDDMFTGVTGVELSPDESYLILLNTYADGQTYTNRSAYDPTLVGAIKYDIATEELSWFWGPVSEKEEVNYGIGFFHSTV
eukprot:UN33466